jgi:hypothetical protein
MIEMKYTLPRRLLIDMVLERADGWENLVGLVGDECVREIAAERWRRQWRALGAYQKLRKSGSPITTEEIIRLMTASEREVDETIQLIYRLRT